MGSATKEIGILVKQLVFKSLDLGEAGIHAEEVIDPDFGFFAAGAGTKLNDRWPFVFGCVLGCLECFELGKLRGAGLLELVELGFGELGEVGSRSQGLRVGDLLVENQEFAGQVHLRLKFRELSSDIGKTIGIGRIGRLGNETIVVGNNLGVIHEDSINLFGGRCAEFGEGGGAVLGGFAVFFGFFAGSGGGFSLEFLHTTDFVDEALLTGEEGVAFGADVGGNSGFGAACLESGTTRAGDGDLIILRMNVGFHRVLL